MRTDELHIIDRLGGPTKVAELLGIAHKAGAAQRVSNWKRRGIPARVLLDFPDIFRDPAPSQDQSHA